MFCKACGTGIDAETTLGGRVVWVGEGAGWPTLDCPATGGRFGHAPTVAAQQAEVAGRYARTAADWQHLADLSRG